MLQQITDLKKENFSLKLRIYFLEERMLQKYGDGEDVFKTVSICRDLVSLWHVLKSPLFFFLFFLLLEKKKKIAFLLLESYTIW